MLPEGWCRVQSSWLSVYQPALFVSVSAGHCLEFFTQSWSLSGARVQSASLFAERSRLARGDVKSLTIIQKKKNNLDSDGVSSLSTSSAFDKNRVPRFVCPSSVPSFPFHGSRLLTSLTCVSQNKA